MLKFGSHFSLFRAIDSKPALIKRRTVLVLIDLASTKSSSHYEFQEEVMI